MNDRSMIASATVLSTGIDDLPITPPDRRLASVTPEANTSRASPDRRAGADLVAAQPTGVA
jgi:hypothetical protein